MGKTERKTVPLSLTNTAIGTLFWVFNGDDKGPSGLQIKDITEAKRQKRIVEVIIKKGVDKPTGKPIACTIEIGPKDMAFLKTSVSGFFSNGTGAHRAVGLLDIIECIEEAEENQEKEVIRKRIEDKDTQEVPAQD